MSGPTHVRLADEQTMKCLHDAVGSPVCCTYDAYTRVPIDSRSTQLHTSATFHQLDRSAAFQLRPPVAIDSIAPPRSPCDRRFLVSPLRAARNRYHTRQHECSSTFRACKRRLPLLGPPHPRASCRLQSESSTSHPTAAAAAVIAADRTASLCQWPCNTIRLRAESRVAVP